MSTEWVWLGIAVAAITLTFAIVIYKAFIESPPTEGPVAPAPAVVPAEPEATGRMRINAPAHSRVFVDGLDQGPGPVTVPQSLGSHEVEVRAPGFKTYRTSVTIQDDKRLEIVPVTLEPDVPMGELSLDGTPRGATVKVDGKKVCELPCGPLRVQAKTLTVEVSASGYDSWEDEITVTEGAKEAQSVRLEKETPVSYGQLSINTVPWSNVTINGRKVGQTPIPPRKFRAGPATIVLVDGQGRRATKRVVIAPNKMNSVFHEFK